MGGIASFLAMGVPDSSANDAENASMAAPWLGLIGVVVAVFLMALALPSIIGGWGLLKYKSWSRIVMIIVSGLNLLHIPLGTALGDLWTLGFAERTVAPTVGKRGHDAASFVPDAAAACARVSGGPTASTILIALD